MCAVLVWLLLPSAWAAIPIIACVLLLLALLVVPPGQTRVVLFFGSYIGTVGS